MTIAVVWVLLGVASLLVLLSCVGTATMRDPLQRLHFVSPPTTLSAALIAAAAFIDDSNKSVGGKVVLVVLVLALMNGVATHATARAARVRRYGTWLPVPGERVPIRGGDAVVEPVRPPREAAAEERG